MGVDYQVTVNVFVGSPNDIEVQRRSIVKRIQCIGGEFSSRGLIVKPIDYCAVHPDFGVPQQHINETIGAADLVIIIVGNRLGQGTREEIEFVARLRERGDLQTAMVYVQRPRGDRGQPGGPLERETVQSGWTEGLNGEAAPHLLTHEIEREFPDRFLFHYFSDFDELHSLIDIHVNEWLCPLEHIPRFMERYGQSINKDLVATMVPQTPIRTDEIVMLEAVTDEDKKLQKQSKRAFKDYVRARSLEQFEVDPFKCYLLARSLYRKILIGDPSDCRHRPFINPVHQQLAAIIRAAARSVQYPTVIANLARWLTAKDMVYPVARDFAAFVLGMARAESARFELAQAVADRSELPAVRSYAAMSLGMIRQRDTMQKLIEIHDSEMDPRFQFLVAHVILLLGGALF